MCCRRPSSLFFIKLDHFMTISSPWCFLAMSVIIWVHNCSTKDYYGKLSCGPTMISPLLFYSSVLLTSLFFFLPFFNQPFAVLCGCFCKAQFGPLVLSRVPQSPPLISNINCLSTLLLACQCLSDPTLRMLAATLLRAHLSTRCFLSKCLSRWLNVFC